MNTRPLSTKESSALAAIHASGLDTALLFLTKTGLHKSILDAVAPLRTLLRESGLHSYRDQQQGEDAKVKLPARVFAEGSESATTASLYRPNTKMGDPRIWIYGLKSIAEPDDVLAVAVFRSQLVAFNLTRVDVSHGLAQSFLVEVGNQESPASELLTKLRDLAKQGPLEAVCGGSTAIGRTLETALGIPINSSKNPDYKGIEIKSGRTPKAGRKANRISLFACVPNWSKSKLKSSADILDNFGYDRGDGLRLYCTLSTRSPNSQLLQLELDHLNDWLRSVVAKNPKEQVAVWPLEKLHERLRDKHKETFWVKASSEALEEGELFTLQTVRHTKGPSVPSFDSLVAEGAITVDHLIKRTPSGGAKEKGPLFKIESSRVSDLFIFPTRTYDLSG